MGLAVVLNIDQQAVLIFCKAILGSQVLLNVTIKITQKVSVSQRKMPGHLATSCKVKFTNCQPNEIDC